MNVYKQVTESSKKVCLQLESYKHREFLPSAATKIMWKVQHFVEQAGKEKFRVKRLIQVIPQTSVDISCAKVTMLK